jgi:hypothetical protein
MTYEEFTSAKVGDKVKGPFGTSPIKSVTDYRGMRCELQVANSFLPITRVSYPRHQFYERFELIPSDTSVSSTYAA